MMKKQFLQKLPIGAFREILTEISLRFEKILLRYSGSIYLISTIA